MSRPSTRHAVESAIDRSKMPGTWVRLALGDETRWHFQVRSSAYCLAKSVADHIAKEARNG